jgi:hypothetical protein
MSSKEMSKKVYAPIASFMTLMSRRWSYVSRQILVDEVSLRLLAFIKELRRTRFNMPNKGFRLKPTEEEGVYELVDNTVLKNPRHAA